MGFKEDIQLNIFKEYESEIHKIANQHGYNSKTNVMLKILIPVLIEYYGEEYKDIIINTLKQSTIIEVQDSQTMYDIIQQNTNSNVTKKGKAIVSEEDLKRAGGVSSSEPIITTDESGELKLEGQKRIIAYHQYDNPLEEFATLVHEIGHAIKSNKDEYTIQQNKDGEQLLIDRSGLIQTISKVYIEDGKIVIEELEDNNKKIE